MMWQNREVFKSNNLLIKNKTLLINDIKLVHQDISGATRIYFFTRFISIVQQNYFNRIIIIRHTINNICYVDDTVLVAENLVG